MDVKILRKELIILSDLVDGWVGCDEIPVVERDLALERLRAVYAMLRFDAREPAVAAEPSREHAPVGAQQPDAPVCQVPASAEHPVGNSSGIQEIQVVEASAVAESVAAVPATEATPIAPTLAELLPVEAALPAGDGASRCAGSDRAAVPPAASVAEPEDELLRHRRKQRVIMSLYETGMPVAAARFGDGREDRAPSRSGTETMAPEAAGTPVVALRTASSRSGDTPQTGTMPVLDPLENRTSEPADDPGPEAVAAELGADSGDASGMTAVSQPVPEVVAVLDNDDDRTDDASAVAAPAVAEVSVTDAVGEGAPESVGTPDETPVAADLSEETVPPAIPAAEMEVADLPAGLSAPEECAGAAMAPAGETAVGEVGSEAGESIPDAATEPSDHCVGEVAATEPSPAACIVAAEGSGTGDEVSDEGAAPVFEMISVTEAADTEYEEADDSSVFELLSVEVAPESRSESVADTDQVPSPDTRPASPTDMPSAAQRTADDAPAVGAEAGEVAAEEHPYGAASSVVPQPAAGSMSSDEAQPRAEAFEPMRSDAPSVPAAGSRISGLESVYAESAEFPRAGRTSGGVPTTTVLGDVINQDVQTLADTIPQPHDVASQLRRSERVEDLRTAIGINDKFLLIRDLFGGDAAAYEEAVGRLNAFDNLDDCMIHIAEHYAWNPETDGVKLLMELLERKFA